MTTEVQEHVFKTVDGLKIMADVLLPQKRITEPTPVVAFFHGGALMQGRRTMKEVRNLYSDFGYVLASFDYRLAPESKLPQIMEDVEDGIAWLRGKGPELFGIDPERMAVVGHSAGGYITLTTGYRVNPKPKVLVSFYGYGDLIGPWYSEPDPFYCSQEMIPEDDAWSQVGKDPICHPTGEKKRGRFYLYCRQHGTWPKQVGGWDPHTEAEKFTPYCPLQNVTKGFPATILLHGDNDTDVPYQQSVLMAEAFKENDITHEFITIPNGRHGFDGDGPENPIVADAFERVLSFLAQHL